MLTNLLIAVYKNESCHLDRKCCDNWRGISLLEVVGKVGARVVQNRLLRSCFLYHNVKHQTKQLFIFIDLREAYNSVPHEALWKVLGKLGIPEVLNNFVRSFHENMTAQIRLNGELLEKIDVNNGLRQGCIIAQHHLTCILVLLLKDGCQE